MDQSPFPVARTKDRGLQRLRPRGAEVAPYLGWTAFNVDAAHLRKRLREGLSLGPSDYSTLRAALAMDWDCSEVTAVSLAFRDEWGSYGSRCCGQAGPPSRVRSRPLP